MNDIKVFPIGKIVNKNGETAVVLYEKYVTGLKGLKDFGYVQTWCKHWPRSVEESGDFD